MKRKRRFQNPWGKGGEYYNQSAVGGSTNVEPPTSLVSETGEGFYPGQTPTETPSGETDSINAGRLLQYEEDETETYNPWSEDGEYYPDNVLDSKDPNDPKSVLYTTAVVVNDDKNTLLGGVFYISDGTFIGQIGTNTMVRLINNNNKEEGIKYVGWAVYDQSKGKERLQQLTKNTNKAMEYSTPIGITNEELRLRALLTTIRQAEKSNTEAVSPTPLDYNYIYGNGTFSDYKKHPNKVVTKWGMSSSAAGAYQFLSERWDTIKKALKLNDFSPISQDKGAIYLINEQEVYNPRAKGVIEDIKSGNILNAAIKLNGTWTSLPKGSQVKMTLDEFSIEFKKNISNELKGKSAIASPIGTLKF